MLIAIDFETANIPHQFQLASDGSVMSESAAGLFWLSG